MQWPVILADAPGASVTPVDAAGGSIVGYILTYGVLGICALAMAWLLFRGWRLMSPADVDRAKDKARTEGRADLLDELGRLRQEKHEIAGQRDDALRVARDQITPMLQSFVSSTNALIPILQEIVRDLPPKPGGGGP